MPRKLGVWCLFTVSPLFVYIYQVCKFKSIKTPSNTIVLYYFKAHGFYKLQCISFTNLGQRKCASNTFIWNNNIYIKYR